MEVINSHILIPFAPDWSGSTPVRCGYVSRSAVADSVAGDEDRASYMAKPRRRLEYTIAGLGPEERFRVGEVLRMARMAGLAAVPAWGRGDEVASVDAAEVMLSPGHRVWAVAEKCFVFEPRSGLYVVREVIGVSGSVIELDDDCLEGRDLEVYPLVYGRVEIGTVQSQGPGVSDFTVTIHENPQPMEVQATWQNFLDGLYFRFFIDTSGSMNHAIARIDEVIAELKAFLRDNVYGGNQDTADSYVVRLTRTNERWVQWFASPQSSELTKRYFDIAFIDESHPIYYDNPRNTANEPRAAFVSDLDLLSAEFARRDLSLARMYCIVPLHAGSMQVFEAFQAHVKDAVSGTGPYVGLEPVSNYNVFPLYDIKAADQSSSWFFRDLMQQVSLFV